MKASLKARPILGQIMTFPETPLANPVNFFYIKWLKVRFRDILALLAAYFIYIYFSKSIVFLGSKKPIFRFTYSEMAAQIRLLG